MSKLEPLLALVALCVACGSQFEAGGAGSAGIGQTGSAASGGDTNLAGTHSGGSAGAPRAGAGGTISEAGSTSAGGAGGAGAGGAGAGGAGGAGAGGDPGAGGRPDCATLKADYQAAVEKARVCQKGVANQCSPSSTLPVIGCGCPVLVTAKSALTAAAQQKYQAIQDARCDGGPICNIACLPPLGAACASQPMISGNLTLCTATTSALAN